MAPFVRTTRMTGFLRRLVPVICLSGVAACRGGQASSPSTTPSQFSIAIEGNCAKLHVEEAGSQTVLVLGTYGLDEASAWSGKQTAHAAQALAFVKPQDRTARIEPELLAGLPLSAKGWIEGDVQVGGGGANGLWLERVVRTPAALNKGAIFEVARDGYTWTGRSWRASMGRDTMLRGPQTALPVASMFCEGGESAFSLLATERASDGTTFVAGRCEDELHRPIGGLHVARFDYRMHVWQKVATPDAPLFQGPDAIVNAGIVVVSGDEAYVHAYRPFRDHQPSRAYLLKLSGTTATLLSVPFEKSIVSLARAPDGTLWTVAGFSELHRRAPNGNWDNVALPGLGFVEPTPSQIRLLEVQTTSKDVWVHGAVPVVRQDGTAAREHVLFTTTPWSSPLHCDREGDSKSALSPTIPKLRLAVVNKKNKEVVE